MSFVRQLRGEGIFPALSAVMAMLDLAQAE